MRPQRRAPAVLQAFTQAAAHPQRGTSNLSAVRLHHTWRHNLRLRRTWGHNLHLHHTCRHNCACAAPGGTVPANAPLVPCRAAARFAADALYRGSALMVFARMSAVQP